jgi:diamine N-acetyltransferase
MPALRPAAPADVEPLLPLVEAFHAEDGYPFLEEETRINLRRLLSDPQLGRLWVFEEAGALVGYLVLGLGFSLEFRGRDAFVDELYVVPSHRGRGLGKQALAAAEAACRELGVRALHLEVERDNEEALGLYLKAGFVDNDRYLMTKWID